MDTMSRALEAVRLLILLIMFFAIAACGGGGGGGGGGESAPTTNPPATNPPTTNPPVTNPPAPVDAPNSYLPTASSIRWTYNGGAELAFAAPAVNNGVTVHALQYPTGGREYFVTSAEQISLQGLYLPAISVGDGVNYTGDVRFASPMAMFRGDWIAGSRHPVSGSGTIAITPTYGNQPMNFSGTVLLVGDEVISTALGSFTAKRINVDLALNATVAGSTFTVPYNVTFWLAPNVGIVRRDQGAATYLLSAVTGLDIGNGSAGGTGGNGGGSGTGGSGNNGGSSNNNGGGNNGGNGNNGGSGNNGGNGGSQTPALSASGDQASLSFVVRANGNPGTQSFTVSHNGDAVALHVALPSWLTVNQTQTGPGSTTYAITANPAGFSAGTYYYTLTFKAGRIPSGGTLANATESVLLNVPVQVTARNFALSTQTLGLTATAGTGSVQQNAAARTFAITGSGVQWSVSSDQSWLTPSQTAGTGPATIQFNADPTGLAPGTHTGILRVHDSVTRADLDVVVTLIVSAPKLVVSPDPLTFSITGDTTMAQLSKTLSLSDEAGGIYAALGADWQLQSLDAPWIASVTPTSGTSAPAASATVTLDDAEVANLAAGTHSGSVTFTYTTADAQTGTATVPVAVTMNLPQTQWIGPGVVYDDQQFEVVLRGSGFSGSATRTVWFDAIQATGTVISDSEIRVTYPPLSTGEVQVRVENVLGLATSSARLFVQSGAMLPAGLMNSPGKVDRAFFDNERQVLYGINKNAQRLERVALQSNAWTMLPALPIPALQDAAIASDGRTLVAVTDGEGIYTLDLESPGAMPAPVLQSSVFFRHIVFTNWNTALVITGVHGSGFSPAYLYDASTKELDPAPAAPGWIPAFYFGNPAGSDDGRRLLIAQNGVTPAPPLHVYNSSTGAMENTPLMGPHNMPSLNRDASRFSLNGAIYDGLYNLLGQAPGVISKIGDRTYHYIYDLNDGTSMAIDLYDLTATPGAGNTFPLLTTINISTDLVFPNAWFQQHMPAITLSGDDETLFLWGEKNLQILPLP